MLLIFTTSNLYSGRRGCSGSQNCTACTSCSGCKHCAKEGGTCGTCYTPPVKEKKKKVEIDTLTVDSTQKTKTRRIKLWKKDIL